MVITILMQATISSLFELWQHNDTFEMYEQQEKLFDECFRCYDQDSCWMGTDQRILIPTGIVCIEQVWETLVLFATTFEVLARGFTLGFGIRMLKYMFFDGNDATTSSSNQSTATIHSTFRSFRKKALVSAITGVSLAAFLHGVSVFVPANLRESWFSQQDPSTDSYYGSSHQSVLPKALYRYIRENFWQDAFLRSGGANWECPSDDTTGNLMLFEWTDYARNRIVGTGLIHLANTLETLLRGFSLGFGARMLGFLLMFDNNTASEFDALWRYWIAVSIISGISMAAFINGSSFVFPPILRDYWFDNSEDYL